MKNFKEQFEVVKIDQIVKVEEFKNFYESQTDDSENQLKSSLEQEDSYSFNHFKRFSIN